MTSAEWNEAWELFQQARELSPDARRQLLDAASESVREEVTAMLADDEPEPERPVPGRVYGKYTLVALLGSGGMGEVFSARDDELRRLVAMKFVGAKARLLPAAMQNLVREAQAASALNHPNLVTVHEVLRFEDGVALVTELVQGQSLRAFCGAPRPIQQVAVWGAQTARALAAAHAESIVHSDIKPENIMLRGDGFIKVLDFGLAKHGEITGGVESLPIGTLGYMSPEQTRGRGLTGASDVFSLGVTLHELLSGKHPFLETTARATTEAINHRAVEFAPPAVRGGKPFARLLRAMLDKDPTKRPTALRVAEELDRIAAPGAMERLKSTWPWAAAAAAVITGLWFARDNSQPLRVTAPVAVTRYNGIEQMPSLSPDGRRLLFVWSGVDGVQDDVYLRLLNDSGSQSIRLTNDPNREFTPVFSPDGKSIAWQRRALDGGDTAVMVADFDGESPGPPRQVASVADHEGFFGLAWWPDSSALVTRDREAGGFPLVKLNVGDGARTVLTDVRNAQHCRPVLSPDRKRFAFVHVTAPKSSICTYEIATGTVACRSMSMYVRSLAWATDSRTILHSGAAALWQTDLSAASPTIRLMDGEFSGLSSTSKRFVFSRTMIDSNIWKLDLATQQVSQLIASSEEDSEPQFSPDGEKILFRSNRSGAYQLYVCARDGSGLTQLTSLRGHLGSGRWSPDGKWIAFDHGQTPDTEGKTTHDNIYLMPSGGGTPKRITDDSAECIVPGWSADSKSIYFTRGAKREAWRIKIDGGSAERVSENEMWDAKPSIDGKWLWFERPSTTKGIWRRTLADGQETRVPGTEELAYRTWDISADGPFYLRLGAKPGFVRQTGATAQLVGPSPKRLLHGPRTMAVSPDGTTILYTAEDLVIGDIHTMEIEDRN